MKFKSFGGISILVVDDEEAVVNTLEAMLGCFDCKVIPKTCSIEALQIFEADSHKIDLVITDLCMPRMMGDVLIKELKKIRHDIPIILCTALSDSQIRRELERLPIKALVGKPMSLNSLFDVVQKAIV